MCCCVRPQAVKEKQSFERIEVSRDEALSMFEENKFKVGQGAWRAGGWLRVFVFLLVVGGCGRGEYVCVWVR